MLALRCRAPPGAPAPDAQRVRRVRRVAGLALQEGARSDAARALLQAPRRRLSVRAAAARPRGGAAAPDPGDWAHSPEWWGTQAGGWGRDAGRTLFRQPSPAGNGVVCVTAHDCALPGPAGEPQEWRVLRFGDETRQSVSLVTLQTAASPAAGCAHVLAFEYIRTMAATSLALWHHATSRGAGGADAPLPRGARVLCVGGGGGTLPMFLAATLPDAQVDVVELCPSVIAAMPHCGFAQHPPRLHLHHADGAAFVAAAARAICDDRTAPPYDLVLVDAFDASDEVPTALTAPPFLAQLARVLHPTRGAALLNTHGGLRPDAAQSALFSAAAALLRWSGGGAESAVGRAVGVRERGFDAASEKGARVEAAARALAAAVGGAAFTLSVARQDNIICCAARGLAAEARAGGAAALAAALATAATAAGEAAGVAFDCAPRAVRGITTVAPAPQARADAAGSMDGAALQ